LISLFVWLTLDHITRNADIPSRRKYVDLADSVKDMGGDVHVFSSMHPSGERECLPVLIVIDFLSSGKVMICSETSFQKIPEVLRFISSMSWS
jgi:hypothetical protein